jgi:hypothetical protein
MAGSFNFEADPAHECGGSAYESDRTLIEFGRVPGARITVDDETVLPREYTQEFADVAPAIHRVGQRISLRAKSVLSQSKMANRYGAIRDFSAVRAILSRDVFRHPFRMREVGKYGTGNCEMV